MENLKDIVRARYNQIAHQSKQQNQSSCCGSGSSCCGVEYVFIGEEYKNVEGHVQDADLGLGCGVPTEHAAIKEGDTVLDLGSGAGNDCFVARAIVGETGKVIGLDFAGAMHQKAKENVRKLGYTNVEFVHGDIEEMPLPDDLADVIISNCVLNLVPDKVKAFREMYRVMKPGGHFCVSDVVIRGELPEKLKDDAIMYAGCVAGAVPKEEYLSMITEAGFTGISVKKEKEIILPDDILRNYFSKNEIEAFRKADVGIYSVTVFGVKN
jgi:ubiquinone/menaquinone biosynthesis C-methylase UbiE